MKQSKKEDFTGSLIADHAKLAALCRRLKVAGSFGIDTEFIGETSYTPILCLIQISLGTEVELVDPMAIADLSPFLDLVADPTVLKICHAGEQDLAILSQLCGSRLANVMDTQILAGLIGLGYPLSYAKLVEYFCGVSLAKAHTYSAWDRRPLTPAQHEYAIDDVKYLAAIYAALWERLAVLQRQAWATAACAERCDVAAKPAAPALAYLKIKAPRHLNSLQLAVLRELCAWREQLAYEHDLPARTMLPDNVLRDIAKQLPARSNQLKNIKDFPQRELQSYAEFIVSLVARLKAQPASTYPPAPDELDETPETRVFGETAWALAQVICLSIHISTALVTSQTDVLELAQNLRAARSIVDHKLMCGWRHECLGKTLLECLTADRQLTLSCRHGVLESQMQ
ncbi:MAG: ribonuclease D [Phycisphaerae bacterium]